MKFLLFLSENKKHKKSGKRIFASIVISAVDLFMFALIPSVMTIICLSTEDFIKTSVWLANAEFSLESFPSIIGMLVIVPLVLHYGGLTLEIYTNPERETLRHWPLFNGAASNDPDDKVIRWLENIERGIFMAPSLKNIFVPFHGISLLLSYTCFRLANKDSRLKVRDNARALKELFNN